MSNINIDENSKCPQRGTNPDFDQFLDEVRADMKDEDEEIDDNEAWALYQAFSLTEGNLITDDESVAENASDIVEHIYAEDENHQVETTEKNVDSSLIVSDLSNGGTTDIKLNDELDIFEASLPSEMPAACVKKIREAFKSTLAEPSLTELVPIVRETLPEHMPLSWLKKKNVRDARFAINKANEEQLIDSHTLHAMLQVEACANNIDKALAFHDEQFALSGEVSLEIIAFS